MSEDENCIGGDGGPLVLLQASAVAQWQGANDFDNSLMNGGSVETDYDIICDSRNPEGVCILSRYERDMLVLWDSEFGATLRDPRLLSLPFDTLILTMCYADEDLPDILPLLLECIRQGRPQRSLFFNMQDAALRLQVGADCSIPSYGYPYVDLPMVPGKKRCDIYSIEHYSPQDEVVVIKPA